MSPAACLGRRLISDDLIEAVFTLRNGQGYATCWASRVIPSAIQLH